jgi:hypothetical protein
MSPQPSKDDTSVVIDCPTCKRTIWAGGSCPACDLYPLEEEHKKHKLRGGETPDDEANYRKGKRGK